MRHTSQLIYACPFCSSGAGIITIDLDRLTDGLDPIAAAHDVDATTEPPAPIILFDQADPPGRPCPHLVWLIIDGAARRLPTFRPTAPCKFANEYTHAAVTEVDRDRLIRYAAHRDTDSGCYPRLPHQVHHVGLDQTYAGRPWQGRVRGWIVVALEPDLFLPELERRELQDWDGGGVWCRYRQPCTST